MQGLKTVQLCLNVKSTPVLSKNMRSKFQPSEQLIHYSKATELATCTFIYSLDIRDKYCNTIQHVNSQQWEVKKIKKNCQRLVYKSAAYTKALHHQFHIQVQTLFHNLDFGTMTRVLYCATKAIKSVARHDPQRCQRGILKKLDYSPTPHASCNSSVVINFNG